jgi:hypothetical protein
MDLTRRTLGRLLATAAAVRLESAAQTASAPAPSSEEALKAAREDLRGNARLLAQVPVPMATEPAFRFKA